MYYIVIKYNLNTERHHLAKGFKQKYYANYYAQKMNRYHCKYLYSVIEVDLINILKEKGLI